MWSLRQTSLARMTVLNAALLMVGCLPLAGRSDAGFEANLESEYQLAFDSGIGFYWAAEGIPHLLGWPERPNTEQTPTES